MSYWTKRRKVCKNVNKHIAEIENDLSESDTEHEPNEIPVILPYSNVPILSDDSELSSDVNLDFELNQSDIVSDENASDIETECNAPYYLPSDSEETSDSNNEKDGICDKLADWAVESDVPMVTLSKLLSILRNYIKDLPRDPRTLLRTKVSYEIENICGGQYYHFGLESGIKTFLSAQSDIPNIEKLLKIQMNIDGLPLFRSSSGQFWPILGRIENIGKGEPFIIGLFYGNSKPNNISVYLNALIGEIDELLTNGLFYLDINFNILISSIICDSPAKAFVKNVKQYSGYSGCDKCTQSGTWIGKITYPEIDCVLRSDVDFENMVDEEHHKGPSPLVGTVGMVSQFPVDYMHLVCLGVVKRLILLWLKGPLNIRVGTNISTQISAKLICLRHHIPSEFARRPRGFSEIDRWKATEFRQFLLYSGPIVLHKLINETMYKNFMLLSVGLHILLNSHLVALYSDYSNDLMKAFVKHFGEIYGNNQLVYNVHGLIHLAADAKKFGSLDNISSFPFENYLKKVKKMVRKPTFPLQQTIRRLSEKTYSVAETVSYDLKKPHDLGPLPVGFNGCKQYQTVRFDKFVLKLRQRDRYFRINGHIAQLENIISKNGDIYVAYRIFKQTIKFFDTPLDSDLLGIHLVSDLDNTIQINVLDDVQTKYIVLPYKNKFVAMPFTDVVW